MSIEEEIRRKREPLPTWKALEVLDEVEERVKQGRYHQISSKYQEVQQFTPRAQVRPMVVAVRGDYIITPDLSINEVLRASSEAWNCSTYEPGDALGYPKPVVKHNNAMLGALKALQALKQRGGK